MHTFCVCFKVPSLYIGDIQSKCLERKGAGIQDTMLEHSFFICVAFPPVRQKDDLFTININ